MNPYKKVFGQLERAKIEYLIVGGVAVNLYGYSRFTGDIDILLTLSEENLLRMEKIMKRLGYVQRLPINIKELSSPKKIRKYIKEKNMTAYTFISDTGTPQLDIDIIVDASLEFKKYFKKKTVIGIWGMKIPVVSIDDLIAMKKKARRDKDLLDVKALLELKSL